MKKLNRKQNGYTLIELIFLVLLVVIAVAWGINIYKLAGCDFKADYKCEIVHGIGTVIFPASVITVWFDTDK